jgi:two-component system sensor kinase FixL
LSNQKKFSEADIRMNAIVQNATDGIITIDMAGIMEIVNPAAAELFGYELDEMVGKNINMLMPEPHHSSHDQYIHNYMRTGVAKIIGIGREVKGKRKDGSIFPCRLSISELQLEDRKLFTGIVHDMTEQKQAEQALKREKERTQNYLDVANTVFVVVDKEERIQLLNRKGCEILNYYEENIIGQNWFDLTIPADQRENVRATFRKMINEQISKSDYFEHDILTKDGRVRLMAWRVALLFNDEGIVEATVSSGIDITEQRAAEERIRKLNQELEERVEMRTEELADAVNQLLNINKQLEHEIGVRKSVEEALRHSEQETRKALEKEKELNQLKSRFVSMASHEFRTPLSTILSSADLIEAYRKEIQQEKREKHTDRIKSAVSNLTGILNDFLSLSKLEEGKIEAQAVDINLHKFCNDLIEEFQALLKPGQELLHDGPAPGTWIVIDKKMLRNILNNLVSNAIKYSPEGKTIYCSAHVAGNALKLVVRDQGIGIPEEEQQHLFTRFFRAHNVENIQGTGLGLNIVKRYVDLMEGHIEYESKVNEGTTFAITIPIITTT